VEVEPHAANTYIANHPGTVMFAKDIREITHTELLRTSPTNKIDLIAACPPCQGFSSLTAKYKRFDPRNELIFEFVRIVRGTRPTTVMMENVPGLSTKGASLFNAAMEELRGIGYDISYEVLDVANYGVPQRRRRLVVLGSLKSKIPIPKPTHAQDGKNSLKPWVTVRDVLDISEKPATFQKAITSGGPLRFNWHVVRNLSAINIERLRATKSGQSRTVLPEELRPSCHQGVAKGFGNVYGRMSWDQPSPTITGGCTTLSKGRFGHPTLLRTISVREAAILQSFPKDYIFNTDRMDQVCQIIGNALPPKFAGKMASACMDALKGKNK
jgi:DNA (cytosine-5)-methyltransferase 1